MGKIVIIKTGSTLPGLKTRRGDFEDWIRGGMRLSPRDTTVVDVAAGEDLPPARGCRGIAITGSHDMVSERLDWSERTAEWLRDAVRQGVPTLGICYGHQLLAHALGGMVDYNPRGPERGTTEIDLRDAARTDTLLGGLPRTLKVHASHSQSVLTLPPGAVLLASNPWDENQAFRINECAWGVQFHPEFDSEIMRAYCDHDGSGACSDIGETPQAAEVLRRFTAIVNAGTGTAGRTPS
ncbi:MAG TPA: glutamine amidotransferase [Spirochaetia bacterium]|nr:glutamine amidotransferase [Spirochaetia bacterium]